MWQPVEDESTGNTYYWHTETGAVQWEKPEDLPLPPDEASTPAPAEASAAPSSSAAPAAAASSAAAAAAPSIAEWKAKHEVVLSVGCPDPILTFEAAKLPRDLLDAIVGAGFAVPSPIQSATWSPAMRGRDVIGIAKTGSGKTLAYLVPAFVRIAAEASGLVLPTLSTLVLAPTRELAVQIEAECVRFGGRLGISSACVYGGAPREKQLEQLQAGVHAIIATPGRLNDFLNTGEVRLDEVNLP